MGFGGISLWQLLILLVIVVLLFGTKRLRSLGSDLSGAIHDFRKGLSGEDDKDEKDSDRLKADSHEPERSDAESGEKQESDRK